MQLLAVVTIKVATTSLLQLPLTEETHTLVTTEFCTEMASKLVVSIDLKKKPWEQKYPLHNRWHPDIPPVAEAKEGELFRVEMMDFSGGAITKNPTADDVKYLDCSVVSSN